MSEKFIAIGDVHGCLSLLIPLVEHIKSHHSDATVVFLGDYVSRGPASKQVIDLILELKASKAVKSVIALRGNHDDLMLTAIFAPGSPRAASWLTKSGGDKALQSYGIPMLSDDYARIKLPTEHFEFFLNLENSFAAGDFFFSHAGVNPEKKLAEQEKRDLIWTKQKFYRDTQKVWRRTIVHGHEITRDPVCVSPWNTLNLDVGSYKTGKLAAAVLTAFSRNYSILISDGMTVTQTDHNDGTPMARNN